MFIGQYHHALEQKGRLSIPKLFREMLGTQAVITQGLDGCLFLFPQKDWGKQLSEMSEASFMSKRNRDWVRLFANSAHLLATDKLGRITIPKFLQDYAGLSKHTVVVGSVNRIEIWDRDTYLNYFADLQKRSESIAEEIHQELLGNKQ